MEGLNRVDHNLTVQLANLKRQKEISAIISKGDWPVIESTGAVPEATPGDN